MTDAQKRIADARETAQELRRSIAAGVRHEAADAIVTLAEDLAAALKRAEEAEAGYRDQNAQAEAWKRTANELYRGSMTEAETDAGLKLMRAHMRQRDEMRVDRDAARTDCQAMAKELALSRRTERAWARLFSECAVAYGLHCSVDELPPVDQLKAELRAFRQELPEKLAQLARYEQAALPESHADAAETAAEIRKSTAAGVRHEAADAILSLLDAVRVLVAEREALREGVRLHLLDDKAAKK